jgi:hypothetical protein
MNALLGPDRSGREYREYQQVSRPTRDLCDDAPTGAMMINNAEWLRMG